MLKRVIGVRRKRREGKPALLPEFCQPGEVHAWYGIKRSMIYVLADRGEIELIHLRPPGSKRGLALVNVSSVRAYIERCRQRPADANDTYAEGGAN